MRFYLAVYDVRTVDGVKATGPSTRQGEEEEDSAVLADSSCVSFQCGGACACVCRSCAESNSIRVRKCSWTSIVSQQQPEGIVTSVGYVRSSATSSEEYVMCFLEGLQLSGSLIQYRKPFDQLLGAIHTSASRYKDIKRVPKSNARRKYTRSFRMNRLTRNQRQRCLQGVPYLRHRQNFNRFFAVSFLVSG